MRACSPLAFRRGREQCGAMSLDPHGPAGRPAQESSPFPGCFILSTILVVFGGLVVLYIGIGLYQVNAIRGFTSDDPAEIVLPEPSAEAENAAFEKLRGLGEATAAGRAERFLFDVGDLNLFLARLDALEDFHGMAKVESIGEAGLVVRMAQPVRRGIVDKGHRYLNGSFVLSPELRSRTVAFRVVDIEADVGEAPARFVRSYGNLDFFRLDPDIPEIQAAHGGLAAVYTEGDQLVVETKVGSVD